MVMDYRALIKENWRNFKDIPSDCPEYEELIKCVISESYLAFEYIPTIIKNNKEFLLTLIKINPLIIQFISQDLISDLAEYKKLVEFAVSENYLAFEYIWDSVKRDKEFILLLLKINPCIEQLILKDLIVMETAVKEDWKSLQYVSPDVQNDPILFSEYKKLVEFAVSKNYLAFKYAFDSVKEDKEFVFSLIDKFNPLIVRFMSPDLQNDLIVMLIAVMKDWKCLQYASPDLKNNLLLVWPALFKSYLALEDVSEGLKKDKDFMLQVIKHSHPLAFRFALGNLNDDVTVLTEALNNSEKIKGQKHHLLRFASARIRSSKHIIGQLVAQSGSCMLQFIDPELQADKEFILDNMKKDVTCIFYASKVLLEEKEIFDMTLQGFKDSGENWKEVWKFIPQEFQKREEFVATHSAYKKREEINTLEFFKNNKKEWKAMWEHIPLGWQKKEAFIKAYDEHEKRTKQEEIDVKLLLEESLLKSIVDEHQEQQKENQSKNTQNDKQPDTAIKVH